MLVLPVLIFGSLADASATPPATAAARAASRLTEPFTTSREAASDIYAAALALERAGDHRALFAHIYSLTIAATANRTQEFHNPRWVEKLVVNYANIYRETLLNELTGYRSRLPLAWKMAFAYARNRQEWSAELDAIYGINVHIARDLVEALFLTPTAFSNESVRADYFHISGILKDTMPAIWRVYVKYSRTIHLFPAFERQVMIAWIQELRVQAWEDGRQKPRLTPAQREQVLGGLDRECVRKARKWGILLPL